MLTISEQAQDVISKIPAQPFLPDSAGLRIAVTRSDDSLTVRQAPGPKRGDRVLDYRGARVFLDRPASDRLDGSHLDVRLASDGRLEFRRTAAVSG